MFGSNDSKLRPKGEDFSHVKNRGKHARNSKHKGLELEPILTCSRKRKDRQ
jgi:hypothetical protein